MTALGIERVQQRAAVDQWFVLTLVALALAAVLAALLLLVGWIVAVLLGGAVVGVMLFAYPRPGLYALVAGVATIEGSSGFSFLREGTIIYRGADSLLGLPGVPFSALELGMVAIIAGLVRQRSMSGIRAGELFWPWAAVALAVLPAVLRGVYSGGDATIALNEIRALFYIPVVYLIAVNAIEDRRHLYEFTAVLVGAVCLMAIAALWVHFSIIRPGNLNTSVDVAFLSHENALWAAVVVLLAGGTLVWGQGFKPRLLIALPGLIALASLLVLKRRVGIIALDIGLILMTLAFIRHNWKLAAIVMPIVIVVIAGYLAVYWNVDGSMGQGARAVRAVIGDDTSSEDISSDTYREAEAANIEYNIRFHPILGSGYGKEYTFVEPLPDLTGFWSFQRFTPHNTVLAVWMKAGILPFILLMAAFGHAVMKGMATSRRATEPLLRAWALVGVSTVPMVFLFGWQDLGLNSGRTTIVLALALAMITVAGRLSVGDAPESADTREVSRA